MPRAKPPRKPHGLERWQGQEASQQYAVRVLTDEEAARTIAEDSALHLCDLAGLTLGSEEARAMLAEVARVLALWPGLSEALAPGAATVAAALGGVERLTRDLRVALDNLDAKSRALLVWPLLDAAQKLDPAHVRHLLDPAHKLDLAQVRQLLLTLRARAGGASRELRGKGRGRPAHRARAFIAVQFAGVFSEKAVAGDRGADSMALARLDFVGAALQVLGVAYSDSQLRRILAKS